MNSKMWSSREKLPHAVVTPSQERHKIIKVMTRDTEFGHV